MSGNGHSEQGGLCLALPPRRASASRLRHSLRDYLGTLSLPRRVCDDLVLAAGEAANNAIAHGGRGSGCIEVTCRRSRDLVLLDVRDHGCGFDAAGTDFSRPAGPESPHGRGLFLIRALTDRVDVESNGTDRGTSVHIEKRIPDE